MVGAVTTFRHVLWIGGPSAGKTTVATRLARRHGLALVLGGRTRRGSTATSPSPPANDAAARWEAMTHEERERPREPAGAREAEPRLRARADDPRRPAAPSVRAARRRSTARRRCLSSSPRDTPSATGRSSCSRRSTQHRAFHEPKGLGHLVEYRWLVAQEVERQAEEAGANVLRVDDTVGADEALAAVEELFAGALAEGPRAETSMSAGHCSATRTRRP